MRRLHLFASTAIVSCFVPFSEPAFSADATDAATSVLELGGSMGKLVWTGVKYNNETTQAQANRYQAVATAVQKEIEIGRAASGVVQGTLGVVGTTLVYAAVVDPEPLSKGIAGIAAWGAKKAGDALGQMVLDNSQERARAILADLLKNNGINPHDLTPAQLQDKVADLKVGGATLRDAFKDDPRGLQMLQANAVDIATDIGMTAFDRATDAQRGVAEVKADVDKMRDDITSYQDQVQSHLEDLRA